MKTSGIMCDVILTLWSMLSLRLAESSSSSLPRVSDLARTKTNASRSFLDDLLSEMDARIRPVTEDGPVEVKCGCYVVSFGSVSEITMDYKITILFREIWTDPRLAYDPSTGPASVSLSSLAQKEIWVPDIFFPNEKEAKFHEITVPNTLMKIYPNGTVVHSVRITLRISCPMNLEAFPMDTQRCVIKLESFSYESHELQLSWMESAVELDKELLLPQFAVADIHINTCSKIYKATGSFSCLEASFSLHRKFGFFLLQTYIPSMLIVILSWVSFWINMDAVPARISLGVTTVLTMTTHLSGSTMNIPKVSYPKAIDVWLNVCMMFVFASLVEYAFVNALSRKYTKDKKKTSDDTTAGRTTVTTPPDVHVSQEQRGCCGRRAMACNVDKVSRVVFPVAFVLFNSVYWPAYISVATV